MLKCCENLNLLYTVEFKFHDVYRKDTEFDPEMCKSTHGMIIVARQPRHDDVITTEDHRLR